mgnify:CR=1 FL=1
MTRATLVWFTVALIIWLLAVIFPKGGKNDRL